MAHMPEAASALYVAQYSEDILRNSIYRVSLSIFNPLAHAFSNDSKAIAECHKSDSSELYCYSKCST